MNELVEIIVLWIYLSKLDDLSESLSQGRYGRSYYQSSQRHGCQPLAFVERLLEISHSLESYAVLLG